ncbi:MAG: 4-hydroxybenzoate octaprenyltransferase [Dehalococcoidia bacterium]|nr:4-hydroxybenzoate octaprenyltransferase [Dehalococcoidia bacterium]
MALTLVNKVAALLENVRIEQSLFTLPFAYLGMVLASHGVPTLHNFLWITVAMVAARTYGMNMNRLVDYKYDVINPTTMDRPMVQGRLGFREVVAINAAAIGVLLLAAWQLNPLCVTLFPIAVVILTFFTFLKRFTWAYNFTIGVSGSGAPMGAWFGVTGQLAWEPVVLGLAVLFWMSGFDIMRDCQSVEFDLAHGLKSVPESFGVPTALVLSALCHVVVVALLAALGMRLALSWPYWTGLTLAAALLAYEHFLVKPDNLSRINVAFFNVNVIMSIGFFLFAFGSLYI